MILFKIQFMDCYIIGERIQLLWYSNMNTWLIIIEKLMQ